jgi:surface antigen
VQSTLSRYTWFLGASNGLGEWKKMAEHGESTSFYGAARVWLAGVSLVALTALLPVSAQASTHHTTAHTAHSVHVASKHTSSVHHVAPAHKLAAHKTEHLARTTHHSVSASHSVSKSHASREVQHETHYASAAHYSHRERVAAEYRHSRLQCVPYAREVSHIDLSGNAFLWWAQAAGRYARGSQPAVGSVLNFRSIGRMPLGHVAVVTAVLDPRTILVTQANWVPGTITNDVTVQDVSPDNDWTDVQVELGDGNTMGSAYPTYGFIYNRPDAGTVIASNGGRNEVAEAPAARPVASEAPNRNLQ